MCLYIAKVRQKAYSENAKFVLYMYWIYKQVLHLSSRSQHTNGLVTVVSAHEVFYHLTRLRALLFTLYYSSAYDYRHQVLLSKSVWQEDYMHACIRVTYTAWVSHGITMLAWFSSPTQRGLITHHRFPESSSSPSSASGIKELMVILRLSSRA